MKMLEINKIHNVDCLEFMKTLPDKCIDLVLTDPPYGMNFVSGHRQNKHKPIENDNNLEWLPDFITETGRILKDDAHAYFFCSFHNVDIFKQEIKKQLKVKNILIWHKNNTGMGDLFGDYAPQYEMIIFCSDGSKKLNGSRDSNIIKAQRTLNELHPTQKPIQLIEYLIDKSSIENDIIFDPFLGSGTTALACKNLKRNYIGCEISNEYYKIANDRLDNSTGLLF